MQKHRKLLALVMAAMLTAGAAGCSMNSKDKSDTDSKATAGENGEKDGSADGEKAEDKSDIRPQDDFYGYVNRQALLDTEIPYGEYSASHFESENDPVEDIVLEIGGDNTKFAPGSNEQLIHDVYRQVLEYKDDGTAEKEIMGNCNRILAAGSINELFDIWGELVRSGAASSVFSFNVTNDYSDGTKYALYIMPAESFLGASLKDISDNIQNCSSANDIARDMHRVMGDDYETADEKGRQMVYLAYDIANHTDQEINKKMSMDTSKFVEERKFTCDELNEIMSNYDGDLVGNFFGDTDGSTASIIVLDTDQLRKINELMTEDNLEKWKTFVFTSYLSDNGGYIRESNDILAEYNPESKEAEDKQAAGLAAVLLSDRIAEVYSQRYYTPELDKSIHHMFDEIIGSYEELIDNADWLTDGTRKSLRKKLDNILLVTTGEFHKVDPRDAELVGRDAFETIKNLRKDSVRKQIDMLNSAVDREKPMMLSTEVNAQYLPCNSINITVAILQPPFFDPQRSDAENLGALGTIVGHEIGHAFDSNCIKYNENGVIDPDWISEADKKVLEERANALSDYYSNYTIMEVFHVDGELTNGENYADLSALECVTNIIDDKTELEKLFRSYAELWGELSVDSAAVEQLKLDEHSPGKVRVNAVLASNKKFNEVYDLKEGDGMYVAPEERVSRW